MGIVSVAWKEPQTRSGRPQRGRGGRQRRDSLARGQCGAGGCRGTLSNLEPVRSVGGQAFMFTELSSDL